MTTALRPNDTLAPLPSVPGGFTTVLADPPWRFQNRTGKVAPEHRRLDRYSTLDLDAICNLPVADHVAINAHLYLWVPNALLPDGMRVMDAWGFRYVSNIVWAKRRKDGGPDGRGVGFYFRNVTELILFGVRGSMRTLPPARSQVNMIETRKREHSRKPDEQYELIEQCSPARSWSYSHARRAPDGPRGATSADTTPPRGARFTKATKEANSNYPTFPQWHASTATKTPSSAMTCGAATKPAPPCASSKKKPDFPTNAFADYSNAPEQPSVLAAEPKHSPASHPSSLH